MGLPPATQFSLRMRATPDDLRSRLAAHIEPPASFVYFRPHKEFAGTIYPRGFEVFRIGRYRNSFRPSAYGQFSAAPNGTPVSVVIKLPQSFLPMVAVLAVIFGAVAQKALTDLLFSSARGGLAQALSFPGVCPDALFILSPVAVPIVSIALAWACFGTEAAALRDAVTRILATGDPR